MTAPEALGDYGLFEELGRGGTAIVRLGIRRAEGGFLLPVACKRLHPEFDGDARKLDMIVDEARLAARFKHPNVVPVIDVVADDASLTLILPFVRGASLRHLFKVAGAEPCPPDVAVAIACDVLAGLEAAHALWGSKGALGVIHRDVSPSNVLVSADGVAQLVDFGIAKYKARLQRTQTKELKGTLAYMAPEQLSGTYDHRVDVYGLAVVLWEALVGRALFAAESRADVVDGVLASSVSRPSRLRPGLPRSLDGIVLRGLERDPEHRWPTARAMREALEAALPRASTEAVSAWVASLAGDELARLDGIVARAEASMAARGDAPHLVEGVAVASASEASRSRDAGSAPSSAPPARRRPRRIVAAVLGATLVAVGVWRIAPSPAPAGAPASGAIALGVSDDGLGGVSSVASSVVVEAPPGAAPPSPSSVPVKARAPRRHDKVKASRRKSTCEVRAWADATGKKHYGEVCE